MAVYAVVGKLGTGKTKFSVWRAQLALLEGRRVASNVDLRCEILTPFKRSTFLRLPDKPTPEDLDAIGHGNPDSYDEERNGVLILDELGTWLNARTFQDKSRAGVIDWLIHARKHGWDVYLIVQDENMIDRQVREALVEYQCRCMNLSRIRIPIIGKLLGVLGGRWGYLPRMHTVTARTGYGQNAVVAERWMYRGDDLHAAYDTRQIFTAGYPHGVHTVLPPWDWKPKPLPFQWLRDLLSTWRTGPVRPKVVAGPKVPWVQALESLPADARIEAWRARERQRLAAQQRIVHLARRLPADQRLGVLARAVARGVLDSRRLPVDLAA
jgi:hypothetical protein